MIAIDARTLLCSRFESAGIDASMMNVIVVIIVIIIIIIIIITTIIFLN